MKRDLKKIEEYAKKYNRIPLYRELNLSSLGFTLVLKALENEKNYIFLESARGDKKISRFSYLCFKPEYTITSRSKQVVKVNGHGETVIDEPLFEYLEREVQAYRSPTINGYGDFNGGYAGYMSFEAINRTGILRKEIKEDDSIPLAELMLVDNFIVYDNQLDKYYVSTSIYPDKGEVRLLMEEADAKMSEMEEYILDLIDNQKIPYLPSKSSEVHMDYPESDEEFMEKINSAKNEITNGEIIQVVLSRRMYIRDKISPYKLYLKIRSVNPSPYMYILKLGDRHVVGCSPETHIKIKNNLMTLKPIAGTASIPESASEKKLVRKELLNDPKERAEHLMLVDLARNDLSRIAEKGSVKVEKYMVVEDYSHVMHIVSLVTGKLPEEGNIVNAYKNTFPAGTVSGAPKVRALEIINDLEPEVRGAYAGTVGYFGFNNNCDTCITIRTAFFEKDQTFLQAGAGIVYDSVPEKEVEEINNKLMALTRSVGYAIEEN